MAKHLQLKAMWALGLSATPSLLPREVVRHVTSHNSLCMSDYLAFWHEVLHKPMVTARFFGEIVAKVLEIAKQERKPKVVLQFDVERSLYYLVHTIQFIDLFCPVDTSHSTIEKSFKAWDSFRQTTVTTKMSPAMAMFERTMSNFKLRHSRSSKNRGLHTVKQHMMSGGGGATADGPVDSSQFTVLECAFVDAMDFGLVVHGIRIRDFSVVEDFPFVFHYLKTRMQRGGEGCQSIFESVLKLLKGLPAHARAKPIVTGSTLGNVLALLHLLREFLTLLPVADATFLRSALPVVRTFKTWPLVYANVAIELERLVLKEIICPGYAFRQRIIEENPLLSRHGEHTTSNLTQDRAITWAQSQSNVVVLFNSQVQRSTLLSQLCTREPLTSSAYEAQLHRYRAQFLFGMIETGLHPPPPKTPTKNDPSVKLNRNTWPASSLDDLLYTIESLPQDNLQRLYAHVRDSIDKTPTSSGASALIRALKVIQPSLAKHVNGNTADSTLYVDTWTSNSPRHVNNRVEQRRRASEDSANAEDAAAATAESEALELEASKRAGSKNTDVNSWRHHTHAVSDLSFQFRDTKGDAAPIDPLAADDNNSESKKIGSSQRSKNGNYTRNNQLLFLPKDTHRGVDKMVKYGREYDLLLGDIKRAVIPSQGNNNSDSDNDDDVTYGNLREKPKVRVVAMGGHDVLHKLVCAYASLAVLRKDLINRVQICVYVVPVRANALASFIARRDGWYRRQVYAAFVTPLIMCPQVQANNQDEDRSTTEGIVDNAMLAADLTASVHHQDTTRAHARLMRQPSISNASGGFSASGKRASGSHVSQSKGSSGSTSLIPALSNLIGHSSGGTTQESDSGSQDPQRNLPLLMLPSLLTDYIRGAKQTLKVRIYSCECWTDPGVVDVPALEPDYTIPFCMRVEVGLGAAVAKYLCTKARMQHQHKKRATTTTSSTSSRSRGDTTDGFNGSIAEPIVMEDVLNDARSGLGSGGGFGLDSPIWEQVVQDRDFIKSGFGPTPELRVSMNPMDLDGGIHDDPLERVERPDGSYFSISICNTPSYTFPSYHTGNRVKVAAQEPEDSAANPTYPELEVNCVSMKGACASLLSKKEKRPRDMDGLKDAMRDEVEQEHVSRIDISCSDTTRRPFVICVDGQLFGPFFRVRVCALRVGNGGPQVEMPVMTYFPVDM